MRVANPLGNGHIPPVYTRLVPHVVLVPTNFFDTYYFLRELLRRRLDLKCDPNTAATYCCVEVSISIGKINEGWQHWDGALIIMVFPEYLDVIFSHIGLNTGKKLHFFF